MARANGRFKPIPGTNRARYLDTETGREVSRRQRDKAVLGADRVAEINRRSKRGENTKVNAGLERYKSALAGYRKTVYKRTGTLPKNVRQDPNFKKHYKSVKAFQKFLEKLHQAEAKAGKRQGSTSLKIVKDKAARDAINASLRALGFRTIDWEGYI